MTSETEVIRDIALIREKILRCEQTKLQLERAMITEENNAMDLRILISEDKLRISEGKRPRYEEASMRENILRFSRNIETFKDTIGKENETIKRFESMIGNLEDDLRKPKQIFIDMRQDTHNAFRDLERG